MVEKKFMGKLGDTAVEVLVWDSKDLKIKESDGLRNEEIF